MSLRATCVRAQNQAMDTPLAEHERSKLESELAARNQRQNEVDDDPVCRGSCR